MNEYNPSIPLISLHIPKCAGQSFLNSLYISTTNTDFKVVPYYPDINYHLDFFLDSSKVIVHGHFVRWKGHSVEDVLPSSIQYTSVIRDPFEVIISGYFYGLKNNYDWATNITINDFIDWWLDTGNSPLLGALPKPYADEDVQDYSNRFLVLGSTDYYELYLQSLSDFLGLKIKNTSIINSSSRSSYIPDRRNEIVSAYPFEYELLKYVNSQFALIL